MTHAEPNGVLDALRGPLRRFGDTLAALPLDRREDAWQGFLAARDDAEAIVKALAETDPYAPPPVPPPARRCATLADLAGANQSGRFLWPRWIVRNHFTLLSSEVKVGKTR